MRQTSLGTTRLGTLPTIPTTSGEESSVTVTAVGSFYVNHKTVSHLLILYCSLLDSPCSPRSDMTWQTSGNNDCCSKGIAAGLCDVGEGDCDQDSDCAGPLVCGSDNCPWGDEDDCCMHPGMLVNVA